jgi:cytochrome c peroxidase
MKTFLIFSSLLFSSVYSSEKNLILDSLLRPRLKVLGMNGLHEPLPSTNQAQVELGKKLFSEKLLSGNKRMSCQTCHNPKMGTSDGLAMSQTENSRGILRRNAPHLFNIGLGKKQNMFWDGRVQFDFEEKIFSTPEPALNGPAPRAEALTRAMTSALSAQALFPLVTSNEMMGLKGENEIADSQSNLEAWAKITGRIKSKPEYKKLLESAYPHVGIININIGHLAQAIGAFEREQFISVDSPFQKYLRGDNGAMTNSQKRGLVIFMNKCMSCHSGNELGDNNLFASVAVPQWGEKPLVLDKGRVEVSRKTEEIFFFKTPSLMNVALTAPYMHNGSLQTIREVIEHYNHISRSLNGFEASAERRDKIPVEVEIEKRPQILDEIWLSSQAAGNPKLNNRMFLTDLEKDYLEIFLREALTDPFWK